MIKGDIFLHYPTPRVYIPRPDRLYQTFRSHQQRSRTDLADVRGLMAEFDLESTQKPQPLAGGNRNHSLLLHTSRGKKILKKYKQSLSQATIIHSHSILTYLAQIDFPSPRLVTTGTGQTLLRQGEDRYALFDFIESGFQYHHYLLFPGQARRFITAAGDRLALLHLALDDFTPQGHNPDGFKSKDEERWRNLDWLMNKLSRCRAETARFKRGAGQNQAARLLARADDLQEALLQLDSILGAAELPRLIIHADYGPFNLLFRKNEPAVILDFEIARLDWRIADLVLAWYRFGHDKLGFRFNKMKWFLEGYQTRWPLTKVELELLPAVWKYLYLWQGIAQWDHYCDTRQEIHLAKAHRALEMVAWMAANQATFRQNLNSAA